MADTTLGSTQYYRTQANGIENYTTVPYAGNHPYGYTPITQQEYTAGLQGKIATAQDFMKNYKQTSWGGYEPIAGGNPYVGQTYGQSDIDKYQSELNAIASGSGVYAANYRDPSFGIYNPTGQPTEANLTPEAAAIAATGKAQVTASNAMIAANPQDFNVANNGSTTPQSISYEALKAAQASGEPPQNAGEARGAVQEFLSSTAAGKPPDLSGLESQLSQDPGYQQLLADRAEYTNIINQSKSLTDTYQQMIKAAGIPAINTDLLNTQKIIDGTEDDIRREVQATSGFATDSQVLALASSRNKQLIKNYNNLLNTKQMAMENVNTMISLASQDRQNAIASITQKLQIDEQINNYREKMINASKEAYNNVIKAVGYQGLLQSLQSDPSAMALAEKTLGFRPGGLQQIVQIQQNQANLQAIQEAGITTRFVDKGGEIQDTKTGYGFTSQEDFRAKTGMTLAQAQAKGLVSTLSSSSLAEKDLVMNLAAKYADAGISPRDSLATAQAKLSGSRIYQEQVRPPQRAGGSAGGVLGLTNQQIDNVSPLVTQFQNSPIVQNYNTIGETLNAVRSAGSTPTDDIQRIYAFAKIMDPASAVREGEYKTIQDYSTALLQRYGLNTKRVFDNAGFLTQEARGFLLNTLENRFKASQSSYNNLYNETSRRINLIGSTDKGTQLLNNYGGAFTPTANSSFTGPLNPTQQTTPTTTPATQSFWSKVGNFLWGSD